MLLQHGSILLRSQDKHLTDIFAGDERTDAQSLLEKVTCLDDILGRRVELEELSAALVNGFKTALNIELCDDRLISDEEAKAQSLLGKYIDNRKE